MSENNYPVTRTGLYGRQSTIELDIPKWVTIVITDENILHVDPQQTQLAQYRLTNFMYRLIEGYAIAGAVGCSIVIDMNADNFAESQTQFAGSQTRRVQSIYTMFTSFVSKIKDARPYFKLILTNSDLFTIEPAELKHETRHNYIDGPAIVVSNGTVIEDKSVPAFIRPRLAQLIDLKLGIVAKTKNPIQLLTDVIEYNAIPLDVTKLPHWSDRTSHILMLNLLTMISCNILCKPGRFADNTIVPITDFTDEIIMRCFNERNLRARWRKADTSNVTDDVEVDDTSEVSSDIDSGIYANFA